MNKWATLAISALTTFFVTAGTAYTAIGGTAMPSKYQIGTCIAGGLIAAARDVQGRLSPPPP